MGEFFLGQAQSCSPGAKLIGKCGNQLLANKQAGAGRYHELAALLADDRLWVNSASGVCIKLFAVDLAELEGQGALKADCGGWTPT